MVEDQVSHKRKNNRTNEKKEKFVEAHFKEYCRYTSIHGFKYLGEEGTLVERIWWVISICLCICLCGIMIYQIIYKYTHYPVIVTFSMKETRLQKLPFPAITICPRAKISQKYFNLTNFFDKMYNDLPVSVEEMKQINMASTVCDFYENNMTRHVSDTEFFDFLQKSRTDFFNYCQFQGIEMNCTEMFTPIVTEEGICHSFNILDKNDIFRDITDVTFKEFHKAPAAENWSLEEGYRTRQVKTYPRRALRIGVKNSLFVILKTHLSDVEFECASDESGYRVSVNLPSNIPDIGDDHLSVPLSNRVIGEIIPHVIQTSDGVKNFEVSKRDCYFQSERPLKFFKKYSQQNCVLECKTNFTLKECGCVGIHMPRESFTSLCLVLKQECMENAEALFSVYNEDLAESDGSTPLSTEVSCDCKPTCTDITYNTELSYNNLIFEALNKSLKAELDFKHNRYSVLVLYFKNSYVETKERTELYGFSEVISNFGGLLGLFTGFSMLSFIEIIYFVSLRIWGNIRRRPQSG